MDYIDRYVEVALARGTEDPEGHDGLAVEEHGRLVKGSRLTATGKVMNS